MSVGVGGHDGPPMSSMAFRVACGVGEVDRCAGGDERVRLPVSALGVAGSNRTATRPRRGRPRRRRPPTRWRARAPTAGSAWAPWPSTTSSRSTLPPGRAASAAMRSRRSDWSIIGCGRPTGELVLAEVDQHVPGRVEPVDQPAGTGERDVRGDVPERVGGQQRRLLAERPAGEQAAQLGVGAPPLGRRAPPPRFVEASARARRPPRRRSRSGRARPGRAGPSPPACCTRRRRPARSPRRSPPEAWRARRSARSPGPRRAPGVPAGWTGHPRPRLRSRPPTPRTWDTPTPASSSRQVSCCAPVPEAATMPTGPGCTTLANPRPTPDTMAVPASGPITSSPRSAASSFSATSASTGTLSLNSMTWSPARSASSASTYACSPGVEMSARSAGSPPAAAAAAPSRTVRGGGPSPKLPAPPPELAASAASTSASAAASASSPSARMATTMSFGPASDRVEPHPRRAARGSARWPWRRAPC